MSLIRSIPLAHLAWAAWVLAWSCDIEPPEGQFECTDDEECPPNWYCNVEGDGLCYSDSHFPDGDADADSDSADDECREVGALFEFEASDQGFSHLAAPDSFGDPWEWGTPVDEVCHSGTNCFATVLDGDYGQCQSASLVSPAIDLSPCADTGQSVLVRFWHYYVFEPPKGELWADGGAVQLSGDNGATWHDVNPTVAYQGDIEGLYGGACGSLIPEIAGLQGWSDAIPDGQWTRVQVPVNPTLRTTQFRLRFLFGSDRSQERTGWFIDDVAIVVL